MVTVLLVLLGVAAADVGDVRASAEVALSGEAITSALSDFSRWEALFPSDCVAKVAVGEPSAGEGARARLTYTPGPMRRRLTAVVKVVEPGRRVDVDHDGNKGFVTRFMIGDSEGETRQVTAQTYINPPPWPLRAMYYNKVVPAWEACYRAALERLEGGSASTP